MRGEATVTKAVPRGGASVLGVSRVVYLALVGVGFLWAAQVGDAEEIGIYSLTVSWAAMATVALQGGLDRLLLVEVSRVDSMPLTAWMCWWSRRRYAVWVLVAAGLIGAFVHPLVAPVSTLVLSRVLLNDFENISLGENRIRAVSIATLLNGIVSGLAIAAAGYRDSGTLLWASCIGNIVALGFVVGSLVLSRNKQQGPFASGIKLEWSAALPFAGMAIAAVIYQRADIAMMGFFGIGIAQLAAYSIALRGFEGLIAFRGAVVQHEASRWAARGTGMREVYKWSIKICLLSAVAGLLIIGLAIAMPSTGLLSQYGDIWLLVGLIGVGTPMLASHTITSTLIYSKPGSYGTMKLSFALSGVAIVLTILAIYTAGISGVALAACGKEYLSFLVFRFKAEFRMSGLTEIVSIMMWPACSLVLGLVLLSGGRIVG